MDQGQLLSSAVELSLVLLEKNGSFIPFCKAVSKSGETFVYTAGADVEFSEGQAYRSVRTHVEPDIKRRQLIGVAFCLHSRVRLAGSPEKFPAVEVELHFNGLDAVVCYFLYKLEQGKATVLEYHRHESSENLFTDA